MSTLAIIPARSGSKGIPGKNIKQIAGKPLIAWTIEQALNATEIDRVIVTTDSQDIADISISYGAEVPFLRPQSISNDTATTESAMLHCLDWLNKYEQYKPDTTVLLQATSPLRENNAIDDAIHEFYSGQYDSLLSVSEFWHFLWTKNSIAHAEYDYKNRPRRQDISQKSIRYKENGSIYISNTEKFIVESNRLCGSNIGLFIMPEEHSYEIDTHTDWLIVEAILRAGAIN